MYCTMYAVCDVFPIITTKNIVLYTENHHLNPYLDQREIDQSQDTKREQISINLINVFVKSERNWHRLHPQIHTVR